MPQTRRWPSRRLKRRSSTWRTSLTSRCRTTSRSTQRQCTRDVKRWKQLRRKRARMRWPRTRSKTKSKAMRNLTTVRPTRLISH